MASKVIGDLQAVTVSPLTDECVRECRAAVPFELDFSLIAVGESFDIQLDKNLSSVRTLYFALNTLTDGSSTLAISVSVPDTGFYAEIDATSAGDINAFGYLPIIANPQSLVRFRKLQGATTTQRLGRFALLNYNVPGQEFYSNGNGGQFQ